MNKNINTYIIIIIVSLFSIFNIKCSSKKNDKFASVDLKTLMPIEKFNELEICDCNKQANIILDNSILIRNNFKSMSELKQDDKSISYIKLFSKRWTTLLNSCFRKHGANMWMPSDCNDLEIIEEKKLFLYNLGIQIDQGENIKL